MRVESGQLYRHNKTGKQIIVRRMAPDYASGPKALIENADDGPLRPRWISLDQLHTDGKPRKTGYNLVRDLLAGVRQAKEA
ncbi:hypothetical protein [Nocardiopsis synnemataformans]|uniref:hypothetical protein n=1 Tax=Nocardiopsis synnemataformans TaxID=61305 RepID=UPI003EBD6EF4